MPPTPEEFHKTFLNGCFYQQFLYIFYFYDVTEKSLIVGHLVPAHTQNILSVILF